MIPHDFDVQLIGEVGNKRLFAARRDLIWHFVRSAPNRSSQPEEGLFNWSIVQSHVPRYLVAESVRGLKSFNALSRERFSEDDRVVTEESSLLGIYSRGPGSYDIQLLETAKGWPNEVVDLVDQDILALEKCNAEIVEQDELFCLPDVFTPGGNAISCDSRELVEAIAFERQIGRDLKPDRISVFAAYCVWRDLIIKEGLPRTFYEQLIANQFMYDAREFRESPFLDLVMEVQSLMFTTPIWGLVNNELVSISEGDAVEVLMEAMGKLSGIQLTQFCLMDQLHSAGLFLPIAQVIGANSWEQYATWKTQGFHPDSEEEQQTREEVALIKMVGDLTRLGVNV